MKKTLWLRAETKPKERRTPILPRHAQSLIEKGIEVIVESSADRIIPNAMYEKAGCKLVPAGAWKQASLDTVILGLKELPEEKLPLTHTHVYFAHAYKGQSNGRETLSRFVQGSGTLLDLEYLVDENAKRVAAFGYWAGFTGAAVALANWFLRKQGEGALTEIAPWKIQDDLCDWLHLLLNQTGEIPKILVVGAKGRCGKGAKDFFNGVGLSPTLWDIEETKAGGPFAEILKFDIFVNCILLQGQIPPFLTEEMIAAAPACALQTISDVSCDVSNPWNPIAFNNQSTTFTHPVRTVQLGDKELDLIAIDHLPSLLPKESSEDFSEQLYPYLEQLMLAEELPPVWKRAQMLFLEKTVEVLGSTRSTEAESAL